MGLELTDPEDAKLLTLARANRARAQALEGAAVRDTDGRTYSAASVDLPSLHLSALQVAVAMAISSGVKGLEAAAGRHRCAGGQRARRQRRTRLRRRGSPDLSCRRRRRRARRGDDVSDAAAELPQRFRQPGRSAERRQVDADQRPRRAEDRHHVVAAADDPARGPRHRAPARRAARPGRHPGPAQAAYAARRAAQRPGQGDLGRGRRGRGVPAGRREDRPRRPLPGRASSPRSGVARRSRSPPRATW